MRERVLLVARRLGFVVLPFVLAVAALAQDVAPKVEFKVVTPKVRPGAEVKANVVVRFGPHLHAYQNPPTEDWMIPLKIEGVAGTKIKKATYPKGQMKQVGGLDKPAAVYSDAVTVALVLEAPKKSGKATFKIEVKYQQCDEQNCFPPSQVPASALVTVDPAAAVDVVGAAASSGEERSATEPGSPSPPNGPDTPVSSEGAPEGGVESPPVTVGTAGGSPPGKAESANAAASVEETTGLARLLLDSFRGGNYVLLVGLLVLVGLAINLTPCVYPMIPVTISFFSNQAGENRAARLGLGMMYMVGIAVTYGLVGGIAAGAGATFGVLFTQRWFLYGLALLMFALALPMFDVYQIGIPPALSKHLRGRSGAVGALIMGLLVGVAAAPCAGPLIVAIFAEVAKLKSIGLGVLVFGTVGVGIGLPYLVLAAATSGAAKSLPKAGGWMKTVKAILGLVVIGVGLNYLLQALPKSFQDAYTVHTWAAFYALSALYLVLLDRSGETKLIFGIKGLAVLGCGILVGLGLAQIQAPESADRIAWQPFTASSWEQAKSSGKPILIDATANWCAECKTIDAKVFERPETVQATQGVVALKIDWSTGVDASYIAYTRDLFGIKGLPHVIVAKPGGEIVKVHNHLESPSELIESLRLAGARR